MKKINTVNQKSLPERTADAIVSMLHMENYKAEDSRLLIRFCSLSQ